MKVHLGNIQLNSDLVAGSGHGFKAEIGTLLNHRFSVCFDFLCFSADWRDFWQRTSGGQSSRAISRCRSNTESYIISILHSNSINAKRHTLQPSDLVMPEAPL